MKKSFVFSLLLCSTLAIHSTYVPFTYPELDEDVLSLLFVKPLHLQAKPWLANAPRCNNKSENHVSILTASVGSSVLIFPSLIGLTQGLRKDCLKHSAGGAGVSAALAFFTAKHIVPAVTDFKVGNPVAAAVQATAFYSAGYIIGRAARATASLTADGAKKAAQGVNAAYTYLRTKKNGAAVHA